MPGVDFPLLRKQITIQEVLRLLQFEPTRGRGTSGVGPARYMVRRIRGAVRFRSTCVWGGTIASPADRGATRWSCGRRCRA